MRTFLAFTLVLAAVVNVNVSPALAELPSRSNHTGMQIVPAPGTVTVDGVLRDGEWDRSGRIHVYGSINTREKYSADFCSMWDKEFLYIGLEWRDATPMVNNVDAKGAPYDGWHADAVQIRFVTGGGHNIRPVGGEGYKAIHCDFFYSSMVDYTSASISHNWAMSASAKIYGAAGKSVADAGSGFAMAFKKGSSD